MKVRTQTRKLQQLRRGVMELYISDHPLDCLTCPANGDCELQDMAGVVGLREVRYGFDGANHLERDKKDESNPYFTFDPGKCIVCSRCVRACEEAQGTFALTIAGPRLRIRVVGEPGRAVHGSECVSCGACVQACPTGDAAWRRSLIEQGQPEHSGRHDLRVLRRRLLVPAEMKGDEVVRMVPNKDGHANHGHSCVKGRFAMRLRDAHGPHHEADDPREDHRSVARGQLGRGDRLRRVASSSASRRSTAATRSAASPRRAARTRKPTWCRSSCAPAFGNNNVDTCARVCHSPTGYGLKTDAGRIGRHAELRFGR